jgi:hypothetical protein
MNALAPVLPQIRKLIRLLGSDRDGEVLGAARAIVRVLHGVGLDLHDLAATLEAPRTRPPRFRSPPPPPSSNWRVDLELAAHQLGLLNDRERDFVANLMASAQWRAPTQRQQARLASIAARLRRRAAA